MDAYNLYECDLADPRTMQQVITLCAELQRDIRALTAQVAELTAMRDTLNAVFTIEAPAKCKACGGTGELGDGVHECAECKGTGLWMDNLGYDHFCWPCKGTGKVQP